MKFMIETLLFLEVILCLVLAKSEDTDNTSIHLLERLLNLLRNEKGYEKRGGCGVQSKLTPEQADEALRLHNDYKRKEVNAANMMEFEYNKDLADRVQEYLERCTWGHGLMTTCDGTPLSQNLAYRAYGPDYKLNITNILEGWYNEKQYFDYDSNTCPGKICSHYTTMVWAKSYQVGCGVTTCPELKGTTAKDAIWFGCDYFPEGNKVGKVYDSGAQCSKCPTEPGSGVKCNNGLCAKCELGQDSNCKCTYKSDCSNNSDFDEASCSCRCKSGYYGNDCENPCTCEDKSWMCQQMAQWCENDLMKTFLEENGCRKSCGWCEAPPGACPTV